MLDLEAIANHKDGVCCLGMLFNLLRKLKIYSVAWSAFKHGTSDDPIWVEMRANISGKALFSCPPWENQKDSVLFYRYSSGKRLDYIVSQYVN